MYFFKLKNNIEMSSIIFPNYFSGFPNSLNGTKLEEKLENGKISLDEFLQDDEAIQCFKDMKKNTKIFFSDKNKIKQLIKYITEQPEKDDYLVAHKYPYVSSEILKMNSDFINDIFALTEEEYNKKHFPEMITTVNESQIANEKKEEKIENNLEKNEILEKIEKNPTNENTKNIDEFQLLIQNQFELMQKNSQEILKKQTQKIEDNEYLDLLLQFFSEGKTVFNCVLSGYVFSVINLLIEKYPIYMIFYLYTKRIKALKTIVLNSYNISISKISLKLLKLESLFSYIIENIAIFNNGSFLDDLRQSFTNLFLERNCLVNMIIYSIDLNGWKSVNGKILDDIDISAIFELLNNLITEKSILKNVVCNNPLYNHLFNILETMIFYSDKIDDKNRYIYFMLLNFTTKIFAEMNKVKEEFIFLYSMKDILPDGNKKEQKFLERFISPLINNLLNNFQDNPSIGRGNGLGLHNIYIMDLVTEVSNFMKVLPLLYDNLLIITGFLKKSVEYFFKYQLNNIYHYKFLSFINIYLNDAVQHESLNKNLFELNHFHDKLIEYLYPTDNQTDSFNNGNIDDNNNQGGNNLQKLKLDISNYKNEYRYKSGFKAKSCIYSHIIYLIYKIHTISGFKSFDEAEKRSLNIINLGEFEFSKDDTSPKEEQTLKICQYLHDIIKTSKTWNTTFTNNIFPIIRKYEGKLFSSNIKPIQSPNLLKNCQLILIKDLLMERLKIQEQKYNDKNFWNINTVLPLEVKNKIENKDKDEFDEEEEILNIAMKLEGDEKKKNGKKNNIKKNKVEIKKVSIKDGGNIGQQNMKDKENDNEEINRQKYNDVNYWEVKSDSLLSDKEKVNLLKELCN